MCERAKLAKENSSRRYEDDPLVRNGCISVLVVNSEELPFLNYNGCELLLLNVKDVGFIDIYLMTLCKVNFV